MAQVPPRETFEPSVDALLTLYWVTNNYILQYRDFAFRAAVYTITLLGACIGLGLNQSFKSLWSDQARGVLLVLLSLVSLVAIVFICTINRKCVILKRRRTVLEDALGYSAVEQPIIIDRTPDTFGMNWRHAIAFCLLIALAAFLAIAAFSR
jgi:hypothetical protein